MIKLSIKTTTQTEKLYSIKMFSFDENLVFGFFKKLQKNNFSWSVFLHNSI